MVFLASGQYTLSMRTYAPFRNVVRSNQRHDNSSMIINFPLFSLVGVVFAYFQSFYVHG